MHSMMAAWKDFLLFSVISYTKRLRKMLQTYVNIQNVDIFFLGYWEKRYKLVWTYKMLTFSLFKHLFIYLFMRQGAGVEPMLGKRGNGILCSGVSGSCEPLMWMQAVILKFSEKQQALLTNISLNHIFHFDSLFQSSYFAIGEFLLLT